MNAFTVGIADLSQPRHKQVSRRNVIAKSKKRARAWAKRHFPEPRFRVCSKIKRVRRAEA